MRIPLLLACAMLFPLAPSERQADLATDPEAKEGGPSLPATFAPDAAQPSAAPLSPDTIPRANIPVLSNALGDVVQDGVINLLDLLRVRDIVNGKPPTGYEHSEADLDMDGNITAADLIALRDILLRKRSVPYLIDSTGGSVYGDGITLTFPPKAVGGSVVVSVQRQSESEFAASTGVDTKAAIQDSAYFMTGFEIKSNTLDFKLPVGLTVKLDSMPPCAYQGLNGLFAVVPDRDGDGRTDLFLINELTVGSDSLTLTAGDIPVPSIEFVSLSEAEPGQSLYLTGHGFGNNSEDVLLSFQSNLSDTSRPALPSVCNDSTIIVSVPDMPAGAAKLTLKNVLTGLTSNAVPLQIKPLSGVVTDIRATIVGFYMGIAATLDSMNIDTVANGIEDITVRNYLRGEMQWQRASVDSQIVYFSIFPDSLLETLRPIAAFIQNLQQGGKMAKMYRAASVSGTNPCDKCDLLLMASLEAWKRYDAGKALYWWLVRACLRDRRANPPNCRYCDEAEITRTQVIADLDLIADYKNRIRDCLCKNSCPDAVKFGGCATCPNTVYVGFGPEGTKVSGGYSPGGGFDVKGTCVNIIRYKRNPCITVTKPMFKEDDVGVPIKKELVCPPAPQANYLLGTASAYDERAHPGSIIKVTNAPVPYNIVGILNENGHAFIPQVPMNTKVTYSLYDPVTGFFDPDVGTYTTGSTPGGFEYPLLLFQPNTQIKTVVLRTGEPVHDSVSVDLQRIDYMLTVGVADTSKLFNVGFSASQKLSLKIEDTQGALLFDNSDVACHATAHLRFGKPGTYRIRVALGVSAQAGSFDLGVSYSPYRPIASICLCGTVLTDSLFYELSPYNVKCSATIPASDTLRTEAGVTLQFEPGGSVTATGALIGAGTPEKPIRLKHAGAATPGTVTASKPLSGRKEVQP